MKIGVRMSPHLDAFVSGLLRCGEKVVQHYDGGADYFLAWGWPQAEQIERDLGGRAQDIICIDAHPFALRAGDRSGDRIAQLGNWGFLAHYPNMNDVQPVKVP